MRQVPECSAGAVRPAVLTVVGLERIDCAKSACPARVSRASQDVDVSAQPVVCNPIEEQHALNETGKGQARKEDSPLFCLLGVKQTVAVR